MYYKPIAKAARAPAPEPRLPLATGLMIAFSISAMLWALIVLTILALQ